MQNNPGERSGMAWLHVCLRTPVNNPAGTDPALPYRLCAVAGPQIPEHLAAVTVLEIAFLEKAAHWIGTDPRSTGAECTDCSTPTEILRR